jgi:hypothetical protein
VYVLFGQLGLEVGRVQLHFLEANAFGAVGL